MSNATDENNAATAHKEMGHEFEVPSRVRCEHPVQLGESKIPGAGRGLFVLHDVKEGGLVFEIPNVRLSIIRGESLDTTCDYCFAHTSVYGQTDPRSDLSYKACKNCNIPSYCSPACTKTAWTTYHQYECPNFSKIASSDPEGKIRCRNEDLRTIIRILSLQFAGMIPDEEWEEIISLKPQPAGPGEESGLPVIVTNIKALIAQHGLTNLSMEVVENIIRAYFNNRCFVQLWVPYLSPPSSVHRYRHLEVPIGECLEPFYSMLNHCCIPNCTWLSEGRTLQVRAERDIAAGEELTICYTWSNTLKDRQEKLSGWIGKCTCVLCLNPPREPTGKLRESVEKLIKARGGDATPSHARSTSILCAISKMELVGLGVEAWPMRNLYAQLFRCRCGQYDGPTMLKTWLKLYFFIEPAMRPQESLGNRNRSLTVLAYLLDLNDPTYSHLEPYPKEVLKLAPWLHYQLRAKLLYSIRQCNGPDSYCVKYEEETYEKDFGQLERDAEAMVVREVRDYVPFYKSAESKWAFLKDMNELLAWAELPARAESQLVTIHSV
ncbi:hypothetical protein WAI453_008403 [Rhynchosporium graminicola]